MRDLISGPMRSGVFWGTAVGVVLFCLMAPGGRYASDPYVILSDQIDSGGASRQSISYQTRDSLAVPLAQVISRSETFENRSGLAHLIEDLLPGDLDENGRVDKHDLLLFSLSWMTEPGVPGYNYTADLNRSVIDRRVTEEDLLLLIEIIRQ